MFPFSMSQVELSKTSSDSKLITKKINYSWKMFT